MSASFASLMYAFLALPLAAIVLLNLLPRKFAERFSWGLGLFICLFQMVTAVVAVLLLVQFNKASINFSQFWDMHIADDAAFLSVDILSALVLFCIGMVGAASFVTAASTIRDSIFNYSNLMMVLLLGLNGVALVTDLFSIYIFVEVCCVAGYMLIALYRDRDGLNASFKYLIISSLGTVFILVGCALLFLECGSLRFAVLDQVLTAGSYPDPVMIWISLIFLLAGFGVKGGSVPFHGWVPAAESAASSPVSVMFSGVVTQTTGIYALIRLLDVFMMEQFSAVNIALMLIALLSIVIGALSSGAQDDFKRALAYASISLTGYVLLGVSCGSSLGYIGALICFFANSASAATLFIGAAAVKKQLRSTAYTDLGGLQKQMPIASTTGLIASLSAMGVPPFPGFWGRLLIVIAVWKLDGAVSAGVALAVGLLCIMCFLRMQSKVFFGVAVDRPQVHESKDGLTAASVVLSVLIIGGGVAFPVILLAVQTAGLL